MEEFALVTGATGGIGEEFCLQLAARGENLFLTGRSDDKLSALKDRLSERFGVKILYKTCRVDREEERAALFSHIDACGIKLSALYNVAGADTQLAFDKYTQEKILFQTRTNFEAAVSIARYALERRGQNFKMLVVGSMSGACPMPYFALYAATKAAVTSFFSALRTEYKREGVKVTVLMPGAVPTRADIVEDIRIQGLKGRLSSKPKDFVVRKALKGLDRNKRIVIPGAFNKLTYLCTKILPVGLQTAFVARGWRGKEKDAFK